MEITFNELNCGNKFSEKLCEIKQFFWERNWGDEKNEIALKIH